jgi:hypothetical protein
MEAEQKVGAVQLSARLRGVSPPVIRRVLITEQSSLAELHATLQVSFGWSNQHLYSFQIRGSGFVESAVNQVVSKRLVKRQQMRWTPPGAHHLLQLRTRMLNQQLRGDFERWHPRLRSVSAPVHLAA